MKKLFLLLCLLFIAIGNNFGSDYVEDFNRKLVNRADTLFDCRLDTNYCKVDSLQGVIKSDFQRAIEDCQTAKDSVRTSNNYIFLMDQIKQAKQEISSRIAKK